MSIEHITRLTKHFAKSRLEAIEAALALQEELDAAHARHERKLRFAVDLMVASQAALERELDANAALFPEGAKTIVVDGIKVGFQRSKGGVELPENQDLAAVWLQEQETLALRRGDAEAAARCGMAVQVVRKLVAANVAKLSDAELHSISAKRIKPADCVLIKPIDTDSEKAVQALIKKVMKATDDAPATE